MSNIQLDIDENNENYLDITKIDHYFNTIQERQKSQKLPQNHSLISTENRQNDNIITTKTENYLKMTIYYRSKTEKHFKNKR